MFLSKRPNGYYYVFYDNEDGKRVSVSTKCRLKSEALKFLSNFSNELKRRNQEKTIRISLKDFFWEYLKYSEGIHSPNTTLSIRSTVNSLLEYFPDRYIVDITAKELTEYIHYRLAKTSPYVARREMAYLSSAFNYGIARKYLLHNHIKDMKKFKLPEKQPAFFSKQEFDKLLDVIDSEDLKDLVIFTINTGLRQMEAITLEWSQVDLDHRMILLDNRNHITKSKKPRGIPLIDIAVKILKKRMANNSKNKLVFTYNEKPIKQLFISHKFKKYVRRANINPKLSFHSLRHTFASWLIQKGASLYHVSLLLGHSSLTTTTIYTHVRNDDLKNSVQLLN